MSFKSDIDAFKAKLDRIKPLAGDALEEAADYVKESLEASFSAEKDPYSRSWKPRVEDGDGHPILDDTGKLKGSLVVKANKKDMTIQASYKDRKAALHQRGTKKMPARKVLPDSGRLPKGWKKEFADIVRRKMKELFG